MEYSIQVKNLRKVYKTGTQAIRGTSFEVEKGEIFGILGPNGAGKTTTLEILEGLREQTSGEVTILGRSLPDQVEEVRKKIGVQLQSSSYLPDLSLRELTNLFASFYGVKPNVEQLLAFVGLEEKINDQVRNLSGGQQQKFSLAISLVNEPEILFLDEPTTGLDPRSRRNLWELVRKVNQRGITVILTTHYMEEAEFLCDRVAIMDRGQILKVSKPKALIDDLKHTTQVSFFTEEEIPQGVWKKVPAVMKVHSHHPKVILEISSLDSIPTIVELLKTNNVVFTGFTVKTATLEDVYLHLTGKEFDSDGI
jgi:ABC-2 type transport system ATP-binding protein